MPEHPHEPPSEAPHRWGVPIRELGLTIAGSALEPILVEFQDELRRAGIRKVRPKFYLSTEWGVVEETIAIAIPFYLARPDLTALHAERVGHIEGAGAADILRYLRHEMGHVVNYAYRLFERADWVETFGRWTSPTARNSASSRSAGDSSATCPAGTRRSTPTRIGRRPSPSG
jgi:hypothetical protein